MSGLLWNKTAFWWCYYYEKENPARINKLSRFFPISVSLSMRNQLVFFSQDENLWLQPEDPHLYYLLISSSAYRQKQPTSVTPCACEISFIFHHVCIRQQAKEIVRLLVVIWRRGGNMLPNWVNSCTSSNWNTSLCPLSQTWISHWFHKQNSRPLKNRNISKRAELGGGGCFCSGESGAVFSPVVVFLVPAAINRRSTDCVKSHPAFYLKLKVKMSHGGVFSPFEDFYLTVVRRKECREMF